MNTAHHTHTEHEKEYSRRSRAGVIPYTVTPTGILLFILGEDTASRDISDWGGSVEEGETIEEAAVRELNEETLGLIKMTVQELRRSYYVYDETNDNTIYFPYLDYRTVHYLPYDFHQKKKTVGKTEMNRVKLYLLNNIILLLDYPLQTDQKLYSRIRTTLKTALPYLHNICNFYLNVYSNTIRENRNLRSTF